MVIRKELKNKMDSKNNYEMRRIQELNTGQKDAGKSLSMVLPKHMCLDLGIGKGDYVKITMDEDKHKIIVEKV